MDVEKVTRAEQEQYKIRSVLQGRQGSWTTSVGNWNTLASWADLWKIPQARLGFLLTATYDIIVPQKPPYNLLKHMLSGCKTALTQGCYRWSHYQVLRRLAEVLETSREAANNSQPTAEKLLIYFIRPGASVGETGSQDSFLQERFGTCGSTSVHSCISLLRSPIHHTGWT